MYSEHHVGRYEELESCRVVRGTEAGGNQAIMAGERVVVTIIGDGFRGTIGLAVHCVPRLTYMGIGRVHFCTRCIHCIEDYLNCIEPSVFFGRDRSLS